ncbi:hypothetical protein PALB_640 [Pseudoalteromonas luteoviolacea B = ATCC 29581]|nr:hypothetical protein PALB_640 [Pseudoalteromonas luteoviolacea B = ATCC 29581]
MRLFLLSLIFIAFAVEANTLRIQVPSDYIPKKGETPVDIGATMFSHVARLVENSIELEFMPASRSREWRELKNNPYACLYNKLKTNEREKDALFSHYPIVAFPSIRLISHKSVQLPNKINFTELLTKHSLKIAVVKGRSYGDKLDLLISQFKDKLIFAEGAEAAINLREQVATGKVDGILEYSEVYANHFNHRAELHDVNYHSLSGAAETVFGYIACARSLQGKMAIANFDEAMRKPEFFDYMINMHKTAFGPAEFYFLKEALEAIYQLDNAQPLNAKRAHPYRIHW